MEVIDDVVDVEPRMVSKIEARIVVTPNPFTPQGQTSLAVLVSDGEYLSTILQRHGVNSGWLVEVGGLRVPELLWGKVRVKHNAVIECRRNAKRDELRLAAYAWLAYVTMGAGNGWLASATGLTGGSLAVAGAVVFAAGATVINRLLPPATPATAATNSVAPTYSLSGGSNRSRMWEPMGLILGQPYVVPDLANQPYTNFEGNDQYLTQVFHAGLNCQSVDTICIGSTAITDYNDVSLYYQGFDGITNTGLPSVSVDSVTGALLDAPTGNGPYILRTTSAATIRIVIDIEATLFAVNSSNGAFVSRTVELDVHYRAVGSSTWIAWPDTTTITNATSAPLRQSWALTVPSGQYQVQIRKITTNETSSSAQNVVTWTQLKSYQQDLTGYPGQGLVGVVIKASGQLSGSITNLNWIATAKPAPYWNGAAWTIATNRTNGLSNPGVQFLQLARGIYDENGKLVAGLGWADSRIDINGLKSFMVWCDLKGFKFDAIIQQGMSHTDLFAAIAYAGMATVAWPDGKIGVSWVADTAAIEGVVNMGNIKIKSFSVNYVTSLTADEIQYGYFDRDNANLWTSLRVQAPDVTVPTNTAQLSNLGITSETHAAILARYAMAQNLYMSKSIVFEMDMEYMTYRRGTVLALSHDMTQWGYGGRVQSAVNAAGVVTLTLDDEISAISTGGLTSRYIGLRLVGETQYRIFQVASFTGTTRSVTLVGTWPSDAVLPGTSGTAMDALWIYDFTSTPGLKVVVTAIEPSDNQGGAKLTVTPLPDEFWTYVFNGSYTAARSRSLLSLPVVTGVVASEKTTYKSRRYRHDLNLSFDVSPAPDYVEIWGQNHGASYLQIAKVKSRTFSMQANLGDVWTFELVPFDSFGRRGTSATITYSMETMASLSQVSDFSVAVQDSLIVGAWASLSKGDVDGYEVRTDASWGAPGALFTGMALSASWAPPAAGVQTTYYIKAFDSSGAYSTTAATAAITVTAPAAVQGLTLQAGGTGLQAKWAMAALASTALPVDRVELSLSLNFSSIIDAKRATTATLDWRSPGYVELFARAVDVAGNVGTISSTSLTVRSPSAPSALSIAIGNAGVVASWGAPQVATDQQPLVGVQLSWLADFSALIDTRSATSSNLGWLTAGTYRLYARYVDAAGNSGAAASVPFTVSAPSAPSTFSLFFGTASIEAKWSAPSVSGSQQPLERVELSWAPEFTSVIDGKKATTATFGWLTAGTYTLYTRYIDVAGNIGSVSQAALQVLPPAQPTMTAVEAQLNAVTLRWQNAKTSQPIKSYATWYGEAGTLLANATFYGSAGADSRSDILFYRSSGNKVAYLVAEDVAGNLSAARQIDLSITMPNNFVLATEYYQDWQSAELTNATIVGGSTGQIILPANDGRTWGQRLSNSGWTTAQQKIDAGYPIVIQPVPSSGKHVEQHDVGKVLSIGMVRVKPTLQSSVAGYTATIRIRGSNGDTNISWQSWLTGESASISNFRYLEVEYSVASDGKGFVVLDDLYVMVEISEVTEAATLNVVATDTAGTVYVCTKSFLDVRNVFVSPLNSPNIARWNPVIDDTTLPAKVYVQAWDTSNNRVSGTVSLLISGV